MADEILNNENAEDVLPEPILREEKYLSAIANNTASGGGGGKVVIAEKTITANGTYNAVDDNANAYNPVTVNVANSYTAGDEGKVVSSGTLTAQTSTNITSNGTVDTTLNNSVVVNVPNTYTASDEGKVVHFGELVAQDTTRLIGENGVYTTTLDREITVNVPSPKPVDNVAFTIIESQTGAKFTLFILPLSVPGISYDCKVGICGYSDLTALSGTLTPENTYLLNDYFTQSQTIDVDAYDYYGAAGRKSITFVIDPATNTISYTQTVSTQDCICYGSIPTNH